MTTFEHLNVLKVRSSCFPRAHAGMSDFLGLTGLKLWLPVSSETSAQESDDCSQRDIMILTASSVTFFFKL
jgi:hypothetical protein